MRFPKRNNFSKKKSDEFDFDLEEDNLSSNNDIDIFEDKNNDIDDDLGLFDDNNSFEDSSIGINPMEKHNDLLQKLTNFDPYIKNKIYGWLGLRWDENTTKWVNDPDIQPIMNKKCAFWCVDFLKTYTRGNNIITNIGQEEYKNMIIDVIDVLWLDIGTRSEEFGILYDGDILRVCTELEHAVELVLLGAGNGKYTDFLGTTVSRHENFSGENQQQIMRQPIKKRLSLMDKFKNVISKGG